MNWIQKISMPLSNDWIMNLHDPDLRRAVPANTSIAVFHGTSSKKLANILQHGSLDPSISTLPEYRSYTNSTPGIYVSTSLGAMGAELYAFHSSKSDDMGDGSDPVVLELVVPLRWIEVDPDDTRIIDGGVNDLGMQQGRITRPVSIKHIRSIMIDNSILAQNMPSKSDNFFSQNNTAFLPIGIMLDNIAKSIKRGVQLPPEYYQMVNERPRGLSRSTYNIEHEEQMANKLIEFLHTFVDINVHPSGKGSFDATLTWVYNNNLSMLAWDGIKQYVEYMSPGQWEDILKSIPPEYMPKNTESLYSYLHRI